MSKRHALAFAFSLLACVSAPRPSSAQFGPPALDHFTVYDAVGQLNPPLAIFHDQFGIQTNDLGATRFLFVPARKNNEPILDPFSHLTCYNLPEGVQPPGVPQVTAVHQFGT